MTCGDGIPCDPAGEGGKGAAPRAGAADKPGGANAPEKMYGGPSADPSTEKTSAARKIIIGG
ncbi:hypothetical protein ACIRU5_10705 [Streptomyces misionensis]|uniref:hypothetical protein n=1 Tax=Streptomyces misionensis TaxID=67331 RepID=UPI000943DFD4|nr:hypothetical protein [Streptomyces misionensis]